MAYLLHQLLSESATRLPEKEAIRFQGEGLTYAQLDELTNQVARSLKSVGVRRGDRVGIYVSKSLASVISVFGIMKAGGVYVPLDPGAPVKRLAFITRNCDIRVVLTSTEKLEKTLQFHEDETPLETIILTDSEREVPVELPKTTHLVNWDDVRSHDGTPLQHNGAIETDLAYILYTSGSTGDPKGVMISHRTILTFINWAYEKFNMTEKDRVTSHAPIHFDLSTFDIYATIKAGGTVVLVPEKLSIFPVRLVKLLQDEAITITYMVPSIYSLMVNYGKVANHDLSNLRIILFAGEVFPIKYLRKLVELIPHPDYYNLYGPTETNVCTYYKVQPGDVTAEATQPVPIGKACENMEVFAVSEQGQLVTEIGQEGELWARGSCVAQGYWGDPAKTADRFVKNKYQPYFDEVAYRTGDIVTLSKDGVNWIYVGRRDHMVKSRGYRIELGEIESSLYDHHGVKEAAVIAIPDDLVGSRIKAFIVPVDSNSLTAKEMQTHCGKHLPRYMVPEMIEFRDELPKTSTGKVNRTLLARA